MMHCPLCQNAAHARTSRYLSTETKERYHQCQNINCGCTFITFETLSRFIVKPGTVDPAPPPPSETNNSNFGFEPASAGFFISVAIAGISAANLPPSLIKKGLASRQPLVL
ncbi:DNA-binding transcriptional regulator [Salmonella enterica]